MDEAAIDKLGFDPIKPQLAEIDALKHPADITAFLQKSFDNGDDYVFHFYSGADFHDAAKQIGYVRQGGLGLPTRDYYLQPRYKAIRDAYVAYIAKSFELTGTPAAATRRFA